MKVATGAPEDVDTAPLLVLDDVDSAPTVVPEDVDVPTLLVEVQGRHCEYHSLENVQHAPETQVVKPVQPVPPPRQS